MTPTVGFIVLQLGFILPVMTTVPNSYYLGLFTEILSVEELMQTCLYLTIVTIITIVYADIDIILKH